MKSSMKRIALCLTYMIAFFSYGYTSCVFGADKMDREYLVIINGIEMYSGSAKVLLNDIINEEDETSIIDKDTSKRLGVALEIIKPGINILINDSKSMARVLELFEIVKNHATNLRNKRFSGVIFKDEYILVMKLGDEFTISRNDPYNKVKTFLNINDKNQITKINFISSALSEIRSAIPVSE